MMRFLISLLLAAVAVAAQTPGSISGRVVDPSGAPVPDARLALIQRDTAVRRSTQSEPSGNFRFDNVSAGEYLLEAQAEGFGASSPRLLRLQPGASPTLDVALDIPRLTTQVQVTAAALAQTVDEQSKALDIIDATQIENRAEFLLGEAIRNVPGLRVQQLGAPGSFTRILTRGMRPADTSILVDGFRLRDAASPQADASAFLGDLLLAGTDRIEVLRGSGSSLYGTHATGGVVNIITDQGGGRVRGSVGAEGGGLGLLRPHAGFSGGAWQDRIRFAGTVMHLNVTEGVDEDDNSRNTSGTGSVQVQLASSTVLSARVLMADSFVQLNDSPFAAATLPDGQIVRAVPGVTFTPAPNDSDSRRSGRFSSLLVALSHVWNPRVSSRVSYSGVTTSRDNRDGPAGNRFEPVYNNSNLFEGRIDTAQARTDVHLGRGHLITAGYEFEREFYDNLSSDENPVAADRVNARLRIDQKSHAAFAQAQGRYLDGRLLLLLSGRLQHFDLSMPQFSDDNPLYRAVPVSTPPGARTSDASAAYHIAATGTRLRAHIGNGYRAPALFERFGASFFFGSFTAYGDPALRPERLLAFDGGFDQYLASSRVRVSGTWFYTRIQEAIVFDFSGAIRPGTDPWGRFDGYRNTGGGLARGVELSVQTNPIRSLTLHSAYTYTNSDDRVSQYGNGLLRGVRISDHMFSATATQRVGRRFDLTFDFFAASGYLIPFSGHAFQFDGPVKADAVASYTLPVSDRHSLRFYTRVENMLNRTYFEDGFRTPKAWAVGGLKWMF